MNIHKIWFLSSSIQKLCEIHEYIRDNNYCEKESAMETLNQVIIALKDEMEVNDVE